MRRALTAALVVVAGSVLGLGAALQVSAGSIYFASITKAHTGNFTVGSNATYTMTVHVSSGSTSGILFTVSDTLPTGLAYVPSGSGNATWTCSAVGQAVTCTGQPTLSASGTNSSSFPLVVSVLPTAYPSVSNTATLSDVCGGSCNTNTNLTSTDVATVVLPGTTTPGSFTKEPNGGSGFPAVVGSFIATGLAQSQVFHVSATVTVSLAIPGAALPPGTQVNVYSGSSSVLGPDLPSGKAYADAYAVAWTFAGGGSGSSSSALTLTVADPAVTASSVVYVTSASGLTATTATVTAGQYVVTFTADPGFVAANPGPTVPVTGAGSALTALSALLIALGGTGLAAMMVRRRRHTS